MKTKCIFIANSVEIKGESAKEVKGGRQKEDKRFFRSAFLEHRHTRKKGSISEVIENFCAVHNQNINNLMLSILNYFQRKKTVRGKKRSKPSVKRSTVADLRSLIYIDIGCQH